MNQSQRMVAALYCLLLVYCCIWIPWRIEYMTSPIRRISRYDRAGYGWLWSGPTGAYDSSAVPDIPLIGLRFLAVSAISCAAMLATKPTRKL